MTSKVTHSVKPGDTQHLAIVFQFGKVASTSLVATLNEMENVEAFQSHFMGELALEDSLRSLMNPDTPTYFFEHQLGQFIHNARLTRRFRCAQAGKSNERLLILSLSREPLEWFRSSVVQDIEGHLPRFRTLLNRLEVAHDSTADGVVVQLALTRLMSIYSRLFDLHDGVDKLMEKLRVDADAVFNNSALAGDTQSQMFFYMMVRPFSWFSKHFETTVGIQLNDMNDNDGLLSHSDDHGDYFIFRYEDLKKSFPACLREVGLEEIPQIARRNVSKAKNLSSSVKMAFQSPSAARLQAHFHATEYARRFNYARQD